MTTFWHGYCPKCQDVEGRPGTIAPVERKYRAQNGRLFHDEKYHDGKPHMKIGSFESEAVGHVPRDRPDPEEVLHGD